MNNDKKISRRDALKRMGAALAGSVITSAGLMPLTSCGPEKKKRIIFYFTGTGNCLYIARQLAGEGKDGAELLSIPQMVRQGKYDFEADEIGLVYPIYGHMPPFMVRDFIQKARLRAEYKFAVLTYGSRKCNAVEIWDEISSKAGNPFDYISTIIMVDNWLPNFDMNEQMKIDKHIPENLARITADISSQKKYHEPVTEEERQQHAGFMAFTGLDPEKGFLLRSEQHFAIDEKRCIDCGICKHVCPRGNYELGAHGAKVHGDCEFCFACIQNCPQKAIGFIKQPEGAFPTGEELNPEARYRNEHISLMDLKKANSQKV